MLMALNLFVKQCLSTKVNANDGHRTSKVLTHAREQVENMSDMDDEIPFNE